MISLIPRPITITYQGKVITITPYMTSSDAEIDYMVEKSMIVSDSPAREGTMATFRVYGMQYESPLGFAPNILQSHVVRRVLKKSVFRESLFRYIHKYLDLVHRSSDSSVAKEGQENAQIVRAIGNNSDMKVIENLSRLPRKRSAMDNRNHNRVMDINKTLSTIPHIPIAEYLDYGTGAGILARDIGEMISETEGYERHNTGNRVIVQGVEVYDVERPIPTLILSQEDRLPQSWNGRFHLVTSLSVLHHVRNQEDAISDIFRVMAPGGTFILREHDYKDMANYRTDKENPFRDFLDAVHIVSMGITNDAYTGNNASSYADEIWARYRSRHEWHHLLSNAGFIHVHTDIFGVEDFPKHGEPFKSDAWITKNSRMAQRIFESVYRKPAEGKPHLVVSRMIERETRIVTVRDIFPMIGGVSGSMPLVTEGVNYPRGKLDTMLPWRKSTAISKLVSTLGRRQGRLKLYLLAGDYGESLIAMLGNAAISSLNVYQRDGGRYHYMLANAELYAGATSESVRGGNRIVRARDGHDQHVYLHNNEMDVAFVTATSQAHPLALVNGAIIFIDLSKYSAGVVLGGAKIEDSIRKLLAAGALMVLVHVPGTDHRIDINFLVEIVENEVVYVFNLNTIRIPVVAPLPAATMITVPKVQGGNPMHEFVRNILMERLRGEFRRIYPSLAPDTFYWWIYERRSVHAKEMLDPVIPATGTSVASTVLPADVTVMVPNSFREMATLINTQFPELTDLLRKTRPFNAVSVRHLHTELTSLMMGKGAINIVNRQGELDGITRELLGEYRRIVGHEGISVSVVVPFANMGTIVAEVSANSVLSQLLGGVSLHRHLPIVATKVAFLRERHTGYNFDDDLVSVLLRYDAMMEPSSETGFAGVNLHAAIMPTLFDILGRTLGIDTECFASPLNAYLGRYMSAFPDVDAPFGSIGSFFEHEFTSGSFEANPPFANEVITPMTVRMENALEQANRTGNALSFFVVVPNWLNSPSVLRLKQSAYKKYELVIGKGKHSYLGGEQHRVSTTGESSFVATFETYIIILQSNSGTTKYKIPPNIGTLISSSFA